MSNTYRVVQLLRNHLYPTYQLHAQMAAKKTAPADGLRLAALVTMEWLRQRLGEHVPEELAQVPGPEDYLASDCPALPSLHLSCGYVVDMVSLPEQGVWCLQIAEPDLGSDPGNPEQTRQAVPGRVIETNIAFKVVGTALECGFQTMISDPEGTAQPAEVYRPSVVRRLIDHPKFGLKQLTLLDYDPIPVATEEQMKNLCALWRSGENHLPLVVFTPVRPEPEEAPLPSLDGLPPLSPKLTPLLPVPPRPRPAPYHPYDVTAFAKGNVTFCRTYQLADGLLERLSKLTGAALSPGDILMLEPAPFGGMAHIHPFKPSKARQTETVQALTDAMHSYPRGRAVPFGRVAFLSQARALQLHSTADAIQQAEELSDRQGAQLAQVEEQWRAILRQKEEENQALAQQLERQRDYQARLEEEKERLRQAHADELARIRAALTHREEAIAYLKRRNVQPRKHEDVASWVESSFPQRLILHPKAVALLEDKSAKAVDIALLCDALDYLATDYWERRYGGLSKEEAATRCSEKYGRPFEVKPTGTTTIEFTPTQYKIKYFPGARGKPTESALDYHLGVGNDPENLLRVYFLHDDAQRLIVVGSLPRHLRAVSIK